MNATEDMSSLSQYVTALTACVSNLEPKAWKQGRRSFPWQVRVDGSVASKGTVRADDFATFIPLALTGVGLLPPPELTEGQAEKVISLLNGGQ